MEVIKFDYKMRPHTFGLKLAPYRDALTQKATHRYGFSCEIGQRHEKYRKNKVDNSHAWDTTYILTRPLEILWK